MHGDLVKTFTLLHLMMHTFIGIGMLLLKSTGELHLCRVRINLRCNLRITLVMVSQSKLLALPFSLSTDPCPFFLQLKSRTALSEEEQTHYSTSHSPAEMICQEAYAVKELVKCQQRLFLSSAMARAQQAAKDMK